jgi:uncharacterized SAM-binding protein YcdF (DUF218 family)
MLLPLFIALAFSLGSFLWIRRVASRRTALIHLLLILVTPWIIVLVLGEPNLRRFPPVRTKLAQIFDTLQGSTAFSC